MIRSWACWPTAPRHAWGRFRPWILWTAVPWAVVMVLACTTPKGWGMTGFGLGVMFAPCAGLLLIYKLNKRVTIEMSDELAERRRQGRRIAV